VPRSKSAVAHVEIDITRDGRRELITDTNPSLTVFEWTQDVTSGRRAIASSPQQRADGPALSHATFAAQRIRRANSLEFASGILIG
jgi:hypothetical protein